MAVRGGWAGAQDPALWLALDDSQQAGILLSNTASEVQGHVATGGVDTGGEGQLLILLLGLLTTQLLQPLLLAVVPAREC